MSEKIIVTTSKFNTILTLVGVALIMGLLLAGYFAWKNLREDNLRLQSEVVQFKKLTDTLVRSSNQWATKSDLKAALKDLLTKEDLKELEKDMDKLDSRLTAVGRTVGSIKRKVAKLEASDREGPENTKVEKCDDGRLVDIHGYTKKPQIKEIKDSNKAPLADVEFDASKKKPWSYDVHKKNYRLVTVVGKKDSGQLTFHHKLEYVVPDKDTKKRYKVNLLSSEYLQVPLKNKMFWLNPIVDVNFFAGGNIYGFAEGPGRPGSLLSMGADVGLSLSSYGETKADSWFRLFRFSLGYNIERQGAHFAFAPFAFNLGKPLPLLTNLYITPQLGIDSAGGLTLNVGIGPQF
jgi:hypothetical protein